MERAKHPPEVVMAFEQISTALKELEKRPVDLLKAPWAEIESSVVKLLGGAFQPQQPEHQMIALGLAGALADRMMREDDAFWFLQRDAPEGAALGFPAALMMLSPFGAVADALARASLTSLDDLQKDIRRSLGAARLGVQGAAPQNLSPDEYQRLFDPGFLQLVVGDSAKVKSALDATPKKLASDVRDGLGRSERLPQQVRTQMEAQIAGALESLEQDKPLREQAAAAPRLVEMIAHLFGTVGGTGFAPAEFWQELVMPVLHVGVAEKFPPLDEEELAAYKQGAALLALYAEVVPYQKPANEEGLMGVFPVEQIDAPVEELRRVPGGRLVKVPYDAIAPLLEGFDRTRFLAALERFEEHLKSQAGDGPARTASQADANRQMMDALLVLIEDLASLKDELAKPDRALYLRRATEGEAASEGTLGELRNALSAPRIILA